MAFAISAFFRATMLWILRYRSSRPFGRQNARLEHDLEGDRAIGRYVEFEIREGETLDPVRDFDTPVALDLPVILNHADRHRVSELGGELSAFRDSYIPKLMCLAA